MATTNIDTTLQVAIIGGGLAGLALATSLAGRKGIACNVYDTTAQKYDWTIPMPMPASGLQALELCAPKFMAARAPVTEHGEDSALKTNRSSKAGREALWKLVHPGDEGSGCDRQELLQEMIEFLPSETLHYGKKLMFINHVIGGTRLLLEFQDGSCAAADVVVACVGMLNMQNADVHSTSGWNKWALFNMARRPPAEHLHARICVVGDAAYAACHFGMDDVLILSQLLADERVTNAPHSVETALRAYETVRVKRSGHVFGAGSTDSNQACIVTNVDAFLAKLASEPKSLHQPWNPEEALAAAKRKLGRLLAL